MTLIALIVAIFCFLIAACIDFAWLGLSGSHAFGWLAVGLVAFAVAHLPLPSHLRR